MWNFYLKLNIGRLATFKVKIKLSVPNQVLNNSILFKE